MKPSLLHESCVALVDSAKFIYDSHKPAARLSSTRRGMNCMNRQGKICRYIGYDSFYQDRDLNLAHESGVHHTVEMAFALISAL